MSYMIYEKQGLKDGARSTLSLKQVANQQVLSAPAGFMGLRQKKKQEGEKNSLRC